jgi:hypothetical protein
MRHEVQTLNLSEVVDAEQCQLMAAAFHGSQLRLARGRATVHGLAKMRRVAARERILAEPELFLKTQRPSARNSQQWNK